MAIAGEGLQNLTYARHLWPLSSEGSLARHIYCDTGHPFIMTRDTHAKCRAFGSGAVTTCFNDLSLSQMGFEHQTFRFRGERSNQLRHRRGMIEGKLQRYQIIVIQMYKFKLPTIQVASFYQS